MIKFDKERVLKTFNRNLTKFKRVKNRFYQSDNDLVRIIEVHFISTGDEKRAFTIDFAVTSTKVLKLTWDIDYLKHGTETGVFISNIDGIINDFKTKPKVKYWDLPCDNDLFGEIESIINKTLIPFSDRFNSLSDLNDMVDKLDFPGKYVSLIPIMNLGLKKVLNKDRDFNDLADRLLKTDREFYKDKIDRLVNA